MHLRLLYLTFQEDAPLYAGVLNKIRGQAAAFCALGFSTTYSAWKGNAFHFYGDAPAAVPIDADRQVMRRFYEIAAGYLTRNPCEVLYVRLDRVDFGVVSLLKRAKACGVKHILLEIPNYPYLRDYVRTAKSVSDPKRRLLSTVKVNLFAAEDRLAGPHLKGLADAAILYGDTASDFYGVPAKNATNGIDCAVLPPVPWPKKSTEIVLIGGGGHALVAGIRPRAARHGKLEPAERPALDVPLPACGRRRKGDAGVSRTGACARTLRCG